MSSYTSQLLELSNSLTTANLQKLKFLPVDWRESTEESNFLAFWNNLTCYQKKTEISWHLN